MLHKQSKCLVELMNFSKTLIFIFESFAALPKFGRGIS